MRKEDKDKLQRIGFTYEQIRELERDGTAFRRADLNPEKIVETMKEWQSLRTRSARRLGMTLSFLVLSAAWVRMDMTRVNFFGLAPQDGDVFRFLFLILAVLMAVFAVYSSSLWSDWRVRRALTEDLSGRLRKVLVAYEKWERDTARVEGSPSVEELFHMEAHIYDTTPAETLTAVRVYREVLWGAGRVRSLWDMLDAVAPPALMVAGMLVLVVQMCRLITQAG